MASYSQQLSSVNPGLILLMIDQSASMGSAFGESSKADFAAMAVNRVIGEIIQACTSGEEVRDRCWVGVVGYGSQAEVTFISSASELARNTNVMTVRRKLSDGAGGFIEVDQIMRVFVPSVARGNTDMGSAFRLAHEGIGRFVEQFSSSFPPVVINITDGEPNDFDIAEREANTLGSLKTADGNVIVMNVFISNSRDVQVQLPASNEAFSSNRFANFLYRISSVLPEPMLLEARNCGFNAVSGSRGFVFNADPDTLIRFLRFGTAMETAIQRVE